MADNDPRPTGGPDDENAAASGPQQYGTPDQSGTAPASAPPTSQYPAAPPPPPDHSGQQQANQHTAQFPAESGQQQGQGWQHGGYYPMNPVQSGEYPRSGGSGRRGKGTLVAAAAGLALLMGLVGGGVGGVVGYQFGSQGEPGSTALDKPAPARNVSTAPAGSVQAVADKVLPSVVQLQIQSPQGSGEGSGVVLSEDGYILTNAHVAQGAEQGKMIALFNDNRSAPVKVVGTDPNSDLAVVKADITGLQPAELGSSGDLPVGAPVVAIGSPFGLSGTVTSGIVSAKDRPVRAGGEQGGQESVLNALQTDAAINPGNSGGPLVDMDGRVVGINSAIYSPGSGQQQAGSVGLGFAIPIDQARRISQELLETGSATQTTLGVQIRDGRIPGAVVAEVVPGSPAAEAGVKRGEVITKIDDRAVRDADTLVAAVRSRVPGSPATLTLTGLDGGGERTVNVTLTGQK